MKYVLSIAGSDPSGGAGIQKDLKTFAEHGVYGMAAITAITAQNAIRVRAVRAVGGSLLRAQIEAVYEELAPHAVKIGLIPNPRIARIIAKALAPRKTPYVVLDPVMIASAGTRLSRANTAQTIIDCLAPQVSLITPNIPEAETLSRTSINNRRDVERAARIIRGMGFEAVLVKGGHLDNPEEGDCADYLWGECGGEAWDEWFVSPRIIVDKTRGTGCTLSSAIAANLAKGHSLGEAVHLAKRYLLGKLAELHTDVQT